MKKNTLLNFTRILYILFAISTIILFWMVYTDIENEIAFKFGIGYMFFVFFLLLYVPCVTIFNLKKLKWAEIRKRIFKFISLFIIFGSMNYSFDYFFRPENMDLSRELSTAFGLAFGLSFIDITCFKKIRF